MDVIIALLKDWRFIAIQIGLMLLLGPVVYLLFLAFFMLIFGTAMWLCSRHCTAMAKHMAGIVFRK